MIPDQLPLLTAQLANITLKKQDSGKYKIDKNCQFYKDNMIKINRINGNFATHDGKMSGSKLWFINQNKSKNIKITNAPIAAEKKAAVKGIIGVSAPEIAEIYNLTSVIDNTFIWNY